MNRVAGLLPHLSEMLRRDAAGEPPLFPPADPLQYARFVEQLPQLQRVIEQYREGASQLAPVRN